MKTDLTYSNTVKKYLFLKKQKQKPGAVVA